MVLTVNLETGQTSLKGSGEVLVSHVDNLNHAFDWALEQLTKDFWEQEKHKTTMQFIDRIENKPIPKRS